MGQAEVLGGRGIIRISLVEAEVVSYWCWP